MLNNTNIYYFKDNFSITLPKNIGEEDIKWKELSWELELTTAGNNIYKVAPKGNNSNNIIFADDGVIVEVVNHNLEVGEVWCMLRLNVEKDVKRYVFAAGIYLSGDNGYSTEDNQQIIVDTSNVIKPDIVSAVLEYDKEEGEINVPTNIQPINYRRSFSVTLYLKVGDTLLSGTSANWRAIFTTVGSKYYECYHRNGRLKNCVINDDGSIRILFENHELEVGVLWCEIGIISDDEEFKEGRRDNLVRVPTGLELVSGYDDIGIDLDLDIVMPYVYVDAYTMAKNAGFTGTREEYIESLVNLKEYIDKGNTGGGGTGGGMTTEQKAQLATAYNFVIDIAGTSADDVINKWQEVVDFLAGIEGGTLEGIVATKADKNTTIIAGDGLTGGGDLSENRTIKVESANDGIVVNSDNIQLNTVDNLTTSSKTKPLSANQGKVLDGKVKSVADLLNDMFEKVTKNGKTYIKTKYGFASEQFVSAGGTDDTESGGSGGANLTQMWESLQGNSDTFANTKINKAHIPTLDVDHIPTLTTGKISDFVSATQAIADTAVANKAEKATTLEGYGIKDAVKIATKSANVSESCVGYTTADHNLRNGGLFTGLGADGLYGSQLLGNYVGTGLYYRGKINGTWTNWKTVAFTDSNVASADKVDGYDSSVLFTCESGYGVDVNAPHRNKESGTLLYKISSNCTNIPPSCTDGVLVHFNSQGTDTAFQLVSNYSNTGLYYRSGNFTEGGSNYLYGRTWKKIAFTDTVLPLTGGTLTGALTVNAPINNTGALKLLGASEVSSTGMAVHSGAKALGSHANALGYYTTTERHYQTVIGCYNEPDTSSLFVIGAGSNEQSRKNAFTVDANGYVRMGNRLFIGVGGKNEVYFNSDVADQLYVHTSAGIPFLIQGDFVRRGSSTPNTTLGTDQYKWFNVFTESLKIADANLTYDIGTLTVDKALKTTSTLTATQGEFANYVKIGNATISWNSKGYLEINEGLASHKFISAGGVVTGDAGGGGGGLSLTDMWVSLNGNIDAYGKSKIHIDHIPLDVILSHDDYENDVASRINTFNYSNSSSFTSAVKALIVADNIPTLEMSKIEGLETTLTNIGTVVQNNYDNLNESISTLQNGTIADHEARIKAIEQALTWQTV